MKLDEIKEKTIKATIKISSKTFVNKSKLKNLSVIKEKGGDKNDRHTK